MDFLVLGGLGAGVDRWVKTMFLPDTVDESSSPDEDDEIVGCIIFHDGVATTSGTARNIGKFMGRKDDIRMLFHGR